MIPMPLGTAYRLHEPIGRGAMGQVWRGSMVSDGSPVAVKVLRAELAEDTDVVARFHREGSIMVAIRHPCVVGIREVVAEGETLAIVMDLIEGGDLRAYLTSSGSLPASEALRLTGQVLAGLHAVHSAGILHRDLKPENILIDKTGSRGPVARLTDFGIGRFVGEQTLTRFTGLIGTPQYLAPEVIENRKATPASDLYSVGIVLYELLTGRAPFTASHPAAMLRQHLEEQPARPEGLSADLWTFLSELLEKDPDRRPESAEKAALQCVRLSERFRGQPALAIEAKDPPDHQIAVTSPPAGNAEMAFQPDEVSRKANNRVVAPLTRNAPILGPPLESRPRARPRSRLAPTRSVFVVLTVIFACVVAVGVYLASRPTSGTGLSVSQLDQIDPVLLEAPTRNTQLRAATSSQPVLELVSASPNTGTDDAWFAANDLSVAAVKPMFDDPRFQPQGEFDAARARLTVADAVLPKSYRGLPLTGLVEHIDHFFVFFGPNQSVRYLVSVGNDGMVRYAFDLSNFVPVGEARDQPLTVQWASENEETLFLDSNVGSLLAVDLSTARTVWRSALTVSGSRNFVIAGRYLISGYYCECDDFSSAGPFVLDIETGAVLQDLNLHSPLWLFTKGERLYVRASGADYIFGIAGASERSTSVSASNSSDLMDLEEVSLVNLDTTSQPGSGANRLTNVLDPISRTELPGSAANGSVNYLGPTDNVTPWLERHGLLSTRPELAQGYSALAHLDPSIPSSFRDYRLLDVFVEPDSWYLTYGYSREGSEVVLYLFVVNRQSRQVVHGFELPGNQTIASAVGSESTLVLSAYSLGSMNSSVSGFNMQSGRPLWQWRNDPHVSLFTTVGGLLVFACCDELGPTDDYLGIVEMDTGSLNDTQPLDDTPIQVAVKDGRLYVLGYQTEYVFSLTP